MSKNAVKKIIEFVPKSVFLQKNEDSRHKNLVKKLEFYDYFFLEQIKIFTPKNQKLLKKARLDNSCDYEFLAEVILKRSDILKGSKND